MNKLSLEILSSVRAGKKYNSQPQTGPKEDLIAGFCMAAGAFLFEVFKTFILGSKKPEKEERF